MKDKIVEHALLSASSSSRWLHCTPSVYLEREEGIEECSVYAEEGTRAHNIAEIMLSNAFGHISDEEYEKALKNYYLNDHNYFSDVEMTKYMLDYVEYVETKAIELGEDIETMFETRVDFSNIVPQGTGIADVILVNKEVGIAHVIDLKYGQGIPVSAKDNSQLMLYSIGVINLYPNKIKSVKMSIYQPRLDNRDTYEMSTRDLMTWAYEYVKPRAEKAFNGEGVLAPSESACKFCKLRGKCKARADMQLELAQRDFDIVNYKDNLAQNLSVTQISNILEIAPLFESWFKDVQSYALGQLMEGVKIPGYKLVEGRSNRIITDTEKVEKILLDAGFPKELIVKPEELQGISTLEKIVGKKLFGEICGEYLIRPMGKLTLAPESDRRPEANTIDIAKSDFSDSIE